MQVYETLVKFTKTGYTGKNPAETAADMVLRGIESVTQGDNLVAAALKKIPRKRR